MYPILSIHLCTYCTFINLLGAVALSTPGPILDRVMDSMWVLARAEWPPHCHVKAFPVVEIIKVKNIGKRFSRLLIKRKGLPPSEEGLPYLLWPSKHVDIVSTLATLLGKIIQVNVTQATRSCTIPPSRIGAR